MRGEGVFLAVEEAVRSTQKQSEAISLNLAQSPPGLPVEEAEHRRQLAVEIETRVRQPVPQRDAAHVTQREPALCARLFAQLVEYAQPAQWHALRKRRSK